MPANRKVSVVQEWIHELPFMQQTVLLSAIRNEDSVEKDHRQKDLLRWFRRCILISAFDGRALLEPNTKGGGSFTGPVADLNKAADDFIRSRDSMSLHYFSHTMHAFEILGYRHPIEWIRGFWLRLYFRMAHALHVWPENESQMNQRLGDDESGWKDREDSAGGCST